MTCTLQCSAVISLRRYVGSDHALFVSSPRVAAFLVALFSEIAQKAQLELCGLDLSTCGSDHTMLSVLAAQGGTSTTVAWLW